MKEGPARSLAVAMTRLVPKPRQPDRLPRCSCHSRSRIGGRSGLRIFTTKMSVEDSVQRFYEESSVYVFLTIRRGLIRGGTSRRFSLARIEMLALSAREIGQFALARSAASTKSHSATLGTAAMTSRWI